MIESMGTHGPAGSLSVMDSILPFAGHPRRLVSFHVAPVHETRTPSQVDGVGAAIDVDASFVFDVDVGADAKAGRVSAVAVAVGRV